MTEIHTWFRLDVIKDENDNPLYLELKGNGLRPNSFLGVYIDDGFVVKATTDSNGDINNTNMKITTETLADFTLIGGFGISLVHTNSVMATTGVIAELHGGSMKCDVRYA